MGKNSRKTRKIAQVNTRQTAGNDGWETIKDTDEGSKSNESETESGVENTEQINSEAAPGQEDEGAEQAERKSPLKQQEAEGSLEQTDNSNEPEAWTDETKDTGVSEQESVVEEKKQDNNGSSTQPEEGSGKAEQIDWLDTLEAEKGTADGEQTGNTDQPKQAGTGRTEKETELLKWAREAEKIRKANKAKQAGGMEGAVQTEGAGKPEGGQAREKEGPPKEREGGKAQETYPEKEQGARRPLSFKERDRMITATQEAVMLFLTIVISAVASFLHGQTAVLMAGIAILAGIGFCSTIFCIGLGSETGSFLFDNEGNIWRFTITYLVFLGCSILFPILPAGAWPYPVIFVGLMLFSNQLIGLSAGCTLLMITSMICGDGSAFFIYFASGLVGIVVFSYANEVVHIWLPLMITMLAHMVCLSIHELLFASGRLSAEMLILPGANLLASCFLMLILLKFSAISRDWNRYMDINDPESTLLAQLKEVSGKDYYHAIHTAYLCEHVVKELFLDARVVKACGYYHRIGLLKGENTWGNVQQILKKNHFPREVRLILREYTDRDKRKMVISKEAVVLLFCDDVISAISNSFLEKKDAKPDCPKIINAIFIKQLESGMIDESSITIGELQQIRRALIKEEAYYDLLR